MAASMRRKSEKNKIELLQIRCHGRRHIGILQFHRKIMASQRPRLVHLTERCRCRRRMLEPLELGLPARAKFGPHTALDESPAHGRRFGLKLLKFGSVLGRHSIGNGGNELRHLHQRTFETAQSLRQRFGIRRVDFRSAEQSPPRHGRGNTAHRCTDTGIPAQAASEAVTFGIVAGVGHENLSAWNGRHVSYA